MRIFKEYEDRFSHFYNDTIAIVDDKFLRNRYEEIQIKIESNSKVYYDKVQMNEDKKTMI